MFSLLAVLLFAACSAGEAEAAIGGLTTGGSTTGTAIGGNTSTSTTGSATGGNSSITGLTTGGNSSTTGNTTTTTGTAIGNTSTTGGTATTQTGINTSASSGTYKIPAFRESVFDEKKAGGNEEVKVDISNANKGYFGVWSDSDARLKLQVKTEEEEAFVYDLVAKETDFFPFQCGDGTYTIRVMKNVEDSKYFELYSVEAEVKLESEFDPFLVACQYADYTEKSECVIEAQNLAKQAKDEKDFVYKIYDRICSNIKYDTVKAQTVQSGYLPVPDETLKTKKGICFDYASLAASMLRSQGIPTKIIFGYVAPDDIYHAWNMFYTKATGWTTVEFKVNPNTWNRIDMTFLANGADGKFVGDGSNYTDVYQY